MSLIFALFYLLASGAELGHATFYGIPLPMLGYVIDSVDDAGSPEFLATFCLGCHRLMP